MKNFLLTVEQLHIGFAAKHGVQNVVNDMTFSIKSGECFAIVGESGSGKSLTALAIMRLLPPNAVLGEQAKILLQQQNLLTLPEVGMRKIRGKKIAMIFQEPMTALNPVLTIGEQIKEVLRCHFNFSRHEQHEKTLTLLNDVGIPHPGLRISSYPHEFSGGQRQRISIAMALAGEPDLLIADEPTTAVDVTIQAQILALLQRLQQKLKMSLLFITHDLGVVNQIADTVAVMYKGQCVEVNNKKNFFQQPVHPYSQKLLSSVIPASAFARVNSGGESCLKQHLFPLEKEKTNKILLSVKNLSVHFSLRRKIFKSTHKIIRAVDDVSFDVLRGQTLAIVGESGSGKTTLAKTMVQLIPPTSGKIQLLGQQQKVQIIFQDPFGSLDPRMRIGESIAEGWRKVERDQEKRIGKLLEEVGLPPESQLRYPHEFSGGQRQRISIARALAMAPEILICDEPTSALDVFVQAQILDLLKQLQREHGMAYLFITHNLAAVAQMADVVAVMHTGKIVEMGNVDAVLYSPKHPYTQQLLAAVPVIESY